MDFVTDCSCLELIPHKLIPKAFLVGLLDPDLSHLILDCDWLFAEI